MNRLNRLFTPLLAALLCSPAAADAQSEALLQKMSQQIRSYNSYRITFTAQVKGRDAEAGQLTVARDRFALKLGGKEFYGDGYNLWAYDPKRNELVIDPLESDRQRNLVTDPSQLLDIDPGRYRHRSLPAQGGLQVVELTPLAKSPEYERITLRIDPATSLPKQITLHLVQSPAVTLVIGSFTPNVPLTADSFRFRAADHPGIEVIDFR